LQWIKVFDFAGEAFAFDADTLPFETVVFDFAATILGLETVGFALEVEGLDFEVELFGFVVWGKTVKVNRPNKKMVAKNFINHYKTYVACLKIIPRNCVLPRTALSSPYDGTRPNLVANAQ